MEMRERDTHGHTHTAGASPKPAAKLKFPHNTCGHVPHHTRARSTHCHTHVSGNMRSVLCGDLPVASRLDFAPLLCIFAHIFMHVYVFTFTFMLVWLESAANATNGTLLWRFSHYNQRRCIDSYTYCSHWRLRTLMFNVV